MELNEQDKQVLDLAQQLLWKKGVNNPFESQVANALTQLAQKVATPQKEPMLKNKEEKK